MSKYTELAEQLDELKKLMALAAEAELKIKFLEVFRDFPDIKNFSWTQYTPYFNDGEPCNFSVHTYNIEINENWNLEDKYSKAVSLIENALTTIDEDTMMRLFGDHVKVTVHWDGNIEINEYAHD